MNDSSRRRTDRRTDRIGGTARPGPGGAAAAVLVVCGALAGCADPFHSIASDYGMTPPREKTRDIEGLDLVSRRTSDSPDAPLREPPNLLRNAERVEVSIAQARAWMLENNLDLRATLVDPEIANQTITEEEGRFDQVFYTNIRYQDLSQPTSTELAGSQIKQLDIEPGVRIPLRDGGTVTVSIPTDRLETNNQFSTLNPAVSSSVQFSLSQPLLRNAGRRATTHGIRIAALNRQISLARTKLEVIRQLAAVERAYWVLYATAEALKVRQMQYELAVEQLERAKRLVAAGQRPEVEITRAQAGVASSLEAIITAENDLRQRQREFKRLVNVKGLDVDSQALVVPSSLPDPVRYDLAGADLVAKAMDTRMELLDLELRLAQDESTIAFQRNQALPSFAFDFTYRRNGLSGSLPGAVGQWVDDNFNDYVFGLRAEFPLGNEQARARVERAVLTRLQRLATREARRQSIRQEVLNAVDAIEAGWQRILAARQSAVLNARTLEAERRQFDVGARTSTEVLDATTRLADAQLSEIRALLDYQVFQVDLAFATGTLLGASRVSWDSFDPRAAGPLGPSARPADAASVPANWPYPGPPEDTISIPAKPGPPPFVDPSAVPPPPAPSEPGPEPEPTPGG